LIRNTGAAKEAAPHGSTQREPCFDIRRRGGAILAAALSRVEFKKAYAYAGLMRNA
jgi:hypothetical protein